MKYTTLISQEYVNLRRPFGFDAHKPYTKRQMRKLRRIHRYVCRADRSWSPEHMRLRGMCRSVAQVDDSGFMEVAVQPLPTGKNKNGVMFGEGTVWLTPESLRRMKDLAVQNSESKVYVHEMDFDGVELRVLSALLEKAKQHPMTALRRAARKRRREIIRNARLLVETPELKFAEPGWRPMTDYEQQMGRLVRYGQQGRGAVNTLVVPDGALVAMLGGGAGSATEKGNGEHNG